MRAALAAATLAASACGTSSAHAQARVLDARAVRDCPGSDRPAEVEDCRRHSHIAYKVLDAFDRQFGAAGKPVKARCFQLNAGRIPGASACLTGALDAALELGRRLPPNVEIADPTLRAVADAEKIASVRDAERKAKSPGWRNWLGVLSYVPYSEEKRLVP